MNLQNTPTTANPSAEAAIAAVLEEWIIAARNQDVERILSLYAQDILAFDAVQALQFTGKEAYGAHWERCLEMCPGPFIFESHDLKIHASDDIAFAHWLLRCGARDDSGKEQTSWMRATSCLRRTGDKWLIVHEHFSEPFDMESGKAMFDLQP